MHFWTNGKVIFFFCFEIDKTLQEITLGEKEEREFFYAKMKQRLYWKRNVAQYWIVDTKLSQQKYSCSLKRTFMIIFMLLIYHQRSFPTAIISKEIMTTKDSG